VLISRLRIQNEDIPVLWVVLDQVKGKNHHFTSFFSGATQNATIGTII
jgi:hypothetical protein